MWLVRLSAFTCAGASTAEERVAYRPRLHAPRVTGWLCLPFVPIDELLSISLLSRLNEIMQYEYSFIRELFL